MHRRSGKAGAVQRMNLRSALRAVSLAMVFALTAAGTVLATPGNGNGSGGKSATAPGQAQKPQSQAPQSQGKGANTTGPYNPSGVGLPSGNGKSTDNNGKRPCAGCVGNADTKNPPGQLPGGHDANRGYECDANQGVGKTNPAHSGCSSTTTSPPQNPPQTNPPGKGTPPGKTTPPANPPAGSTPGPVVLGDRASGVSADDTSPAENEGNSPSSGEGPGLPDEGAPSLPFTGGQPLSLALLAAFALLAGIALRRRLGALQ